MLDDVDGHGNDDRLVIVHHQIAKTGHALECVGQRRRNPAVLGEQIECITCPLRNPQVLLANQMEGQIDGRFAGPLNVQDGGILMGVVGGKPGGVGVVLGPCAGNTPFDGGALVDQDVVGHVRWRPFAERDKGYWLTLDSAVMSVN